MRAYKVTPGGVARIGMGEVVGLTDDQIAPRRHRLTIMQKGEAFTAIRAEAVLEFKAGEIIRLPATPAKGQAEVLAPLEGDDGLARPKLEAAKVAAAAPPAKARGKRR